MGRRWTAVEAKAAAKNGAKRSREVRHAQAQRRALQRLGPVVRKALFDVRTTLTASDLHAIHEVLARVYREAYDRGYSAGYRFRVNEAVRAQRRQAAA